MTPELIEAIEKVLRESLDMGDYYAVPYSLMEELREAYKAKQR